MDGAMRVNRAMAIQVAHKLGLGGLRTVLTLAAATFGGTTCTSLTRLATMARTDRHSFSDRMDSLVAAGFVKEGRQTRNRCWRTIIQSEGDAVEIDRTTVTEQAGMGDALALAALMKSLANADGEFLINFRDLAELAACSRDTLDRQFDKLREAGWAKRQRASRSVYSVRINVPRGTPAEITHVRSPNPLAELRARAMAILKAGKHAD